MEKEIRELCEKIREYLQGHGGDLEVVAVEGTIVRVRLQGACGNCPGAMGTLKNMVERTLREELGQEIVVERVI